MSTITGIGCLRLFKTSVIDPAIDIVSQDYGIEEYSKEELEFLDYDTTNTPYLYKKGYRYIWAFKVYQRLKTDEEFATLVDDIDKGNGQVITFYPEYDGVVNADYQCYLESFLDDCNEYPAQFIDLKLTCVDLTDGDAP